MFSIACGDEIVFPCNEDFQCVQASGAEGTCEPAGFCSFPDPTCPSSSRYSDHATPTLAGECVPANPGPVGGSSSGAEDSDAFGSGGQSSGGTGPSASDSGSTSDGTPPISVDCVPEFVDYDADIAVCTDPVNNDVEVCTEQAGAGNVLVDIDQRPDLIQMTAFLRFLVVDPPAGKVKSVRLELGVTNADGSNGSGEVWLVEPFDLDTLAVSQPLVLGAGPLAEDLGPVDSGSTAVFSLPPEIVPQGQDMVWLAMLPTSFSAVRYRGSEASRHPHLVVEYCD